MLLVFEQLVVLVIIMGAGVVLAKREILNELFLEGLNKFLIRFTLPCMLLNSMMQEYSEELMHNTLILLGISIVSFALLILIVEIWGRFSRMAPRRAGMYQYMVVNGNTGFLGFPVMQALSGELGLFYSSMFCIPNTFVTFTYGLIAIARGSNERITLKKLLYNPPLIASLLGLCLFVCRVQLPYVLARPIEWIGDMTIPISLLIVGAWLSKCRIKELFYPVGIWVISLIRLVILPAVMTVVLYLLGAREMILLVPVVMFGTPVALLAETFAMEYHNDVFTVGKTVMLSNLLAVVSMPLLLTIIVPLAG
jgi:predicted permease